MAGSKNVLLVEDDPMISSLYRSPLVESGYNVEVARSANEMYEKLKVFHPDYIFLDIMLPGVSGLEILKELRAKEELGCKNSKIVILSNLAQRSVTDNAMNSGADGFIIKADILPKDLPEVITSLEEDESQAETESEPQAPQPS